MLKKLHRRLESSLNYCELQSAYRSGRFTETEIVKVVDDIHRHIDSGSVAALISPDISASFDTINHNLILYRLRNDYGICDDALECIYGSCICRNSTSSTFYEAFTGCRCEAESSTGSPYFAIKDTASASRATSRHC